ncbi:MAG TPA: TIM-barrel domain-containing protein [Chloroflexota bacterium]|jgi:alpha-glucosidase (family GH31 glycosyl hydrolase)|nr:TIM-barrel domain-containing protein [Chloroflexota bacterium]
MVQPLTRRAFLAVGAIAIGAVGGLVGIAGASSRERPGDQRIGLGDLALLVGADPWRLSLLGPTGDVLWAEPVDQPLSYQTVDGRTFRARRLASYGVVGDGNIQLVAETDDPAGGALALEVSQLGPRMFRLTVTADTSAAVASIGGALSTTADERFVALGERFDTVNQRGRMVDVWAEDRRVANYGSSTYAPIPLVLSSRGHGFALERFERSQFDLAATRADRWTWHQAASCASIVISYGPTLKDLVRRNAELNGLPPLPPQWLFGVWKTSVGGQAEVVDEMRKLRDLKVPVSAVFAYDAVDLDANIGWPSVTFGGRHAGPYPDHQGYTRALHDLGFKALNYFTADFHLDRANYQEPAMHGFLIHRQDGRPYIHPAFNVGWLDYTDPDAALWWSASWRRALTDLGYDGGMLDLGELIPADSVMADGTSGLQSHNRYPLLYAQSAWQAASAARPNGDFALVLRSAALGAQRFQSAQWNGDAVMRWQGSDGLKSMVPAALSFGLSGFPYWHAEVAGYVQTDLTHDQERELWLRWLQLATWTSLLRDHLGDQPRDPIDVWLDDGTVQAFRAAARVHASLLPYLYSLATEASQTGLPIMRYLPLEAPDDPRAWQEDQSYFLGPTFLVAPVVEPGATTRTVYLPAGEWVDYWRGTLYSGGREVTVAAPVDGSGPPVFARAGAIIPLATEHDTLVPTTSPDIRTWTGDLVVRVMPSGPAGARDSSFTLYDGTRLHWTGSSLEVTDNPRPRSIEFRAPDGTVVYRQVDGPTATLS